MKARLCSVEQALALICREVYSIQLLRNHLDFLSIAQKLCLQMYVAFQGMFPVLFVPFGNLSIVFA
ncbi:hypothetical protein D3C77_810000 [compost metagenome]